MSSIRIARRTALAGLLGGAAATVGGRRAWTQAKPMSIGILQSISGPLGYIGTSHVQGAHIAVKQINESGGIDGRQVELVVRDTKANATEMVEGIRELASLGVNLAIGDCITGTNLAAYPVAQNLNMVFVVPTVIGMEMTHDLFNRNCFRAGPNAYMQLVSEGVIVAQHYPDMKRWGAILADAVGFHISQSYIYYGLKKSYAQQGKQVDFLDPVMAKVGAADYRDQAAQLVSQKLDGMVLGDAGGEALNFLQQATGFGLIKSLGAIADTSLFSVGKAMKKQTPQNFWTGCSWLYDAFKQYPMAQEFNRLAVAETKTTTVDPFLAQAHIAVTAVASGVRNAKSTSTEVVIPAIETTTFDSVYGPTKFRPEDHQLYFDVGFVRLGPDESESGWKIYDFVQVKAADAIEPASPGQKFVLPA